MYIYVYVYIYTTFIAYAPKYGWKRLIKWRYSKHGIVGKTFHIHIHPHPTPGLRKMQGNSGDNS